jgi:hypothetical protein
MRRLAVLIERRVVEVLLVDEELVGVVSRLLHFVDETAGLLSRGDGERGERASGALGRPAAGGVRAHP